jgi:hypothetical protein
MRYLKITGILLLSLLLASGASSQQYIKGSSKTKKISYKPSSKKYVKDLPDLIITGEVFSDENKNNFIDANEYCNIRLYVENIGKGIAKGVKVETSLRGDKIEGLSFSREINLGDIAPDSKKAVSIPVTGYVYLEEAVAEFNIAVREDRGFDAFPLEMKIETRKFKAPDVIVADAAFSTEDGGLIKLNYPINLKVIVQNIGEGDATGVFAEFLLPNTDCVVLGEKSRFSIGRLGRGESRELEFLFTATRRYTQSEIPVEINIQESYNKYARDTLLTVGLEERLTARNQVIISGMATQATQIEVASLSSMVDKNIPVNPDKHPRRYALIIGNEDYSRYQRGIASESNVDFARRDASVFLDYAVKTLGVEDENAFLLKDATAGEMQQKIDLISKLAAKSGERAEIIFFYAGHGLPDEVTKEPHLIPVDVSGTNLNAAVKLKDVYSKLSESGAGRITIFLDACFSGGGRDAALIAARGVKVKPKEEVITGNMVVFSASTGEQSALPLEEEQHGIFTYYLLKKLQETAGRVSYGDLADFLKDEVSIESLKINQKEQDPQVNVSVTVQNEWPEWKFTD